MHPAFQIFGFGREQSLTGRICGLDNICWEDYGRSAKCVPLIGCLSNEDLLMANGKMRIEKKIV